MSKRDLIVVDIETTGLDAHHMPLEVAALNVGTGEELYFVPHIHETALHYADGDALKINRYFERGVFANRLTSEQTREMYMQLWEMLDGNTFAGSNPTFDSGMLLKVTHREAVWHHRLADLAAFAAGVLGLPPTALPGLKVVCDILNVSNRCEHSAMGDARATAECFRQLVEKGASSRFDEVKTGLRG